MSEQSVDTRSIEQAALRLIESGAYLYVRLMDSGQVEGEVPGRLWYAVQAEQQRGGVWVLRRAGGTNLEEALREVLSSATVEPPKRRRVVRRRR